MCIYYGKYRVNVILSIGLKINFSLIVRIFLFLKDFINMGTY